MARALELMRSGDSFALATVVWRQPPSSGQHGSRAIIKTAISPTVAEAGDCSCTIYSPEGDLVVGGGAVQIHFHAGGDGIRKIFELHGGTISDGDIFIVNDPYDGASHMPDLWVVAPQFCNGTLISRIN